MRPFQYRHSTVSEGHHSALAWCYGRLLVKEGKMGRAFKVEQVGNARTRAQKQNDIAW